MEVRGQDKEKETPSSLGYNRDSSSKISSTPRSNTTYTVHGDEAIFNPAQTLDHRHPLYHHDHNQLNPPQDTHDRPRRDPDTDPDPVPAASIATESTDRSTPTPTPTTTNTTATTLINRYRECLKNHAANMGGHVVDGCGEFMPGGEEGTREALKCAACECHRSFHRKEIDGASSSQSQLYPVNSYHNKKYHHLHHQQQLVPPPPPPHPFYQHNNRRLSIGLSNSTPIAAAPVAPLMMAFGGGGAAAEYSSSEDLNIFRSNAGGQSSVMLQQPKYSKKRFRTKFSQEQKDKMMEFAEKIGWRIQKEDEKEVQEFCAQVVVKRQVFKVWMHNNKQQAVKKKEM